MNCAIFIAGSLVALCLILTALDWVDNDEMGVRK